MAIYALKPAFRKALAPFGRVLVKSGTSPDAITFAGVAFAGIGGFALWLGRTGSAWLLVYPVCSLFRTAANALDGWVAQETGKGRPLGEVLNETGDRVADVLMILPTAFVPGVNRLLVSVALAAVLVSSFLGISIKAAGGPRVYAGIMGKPDRMLVLSAAAISALIVEPDIAFSVALWIILAGAAVTFVHRSVIARREFRSINGRDSD